MVYTREEIKKEEGIEKEMNYNGGNVPVLFISKRTLPEAWQAAMIGLWEKGIDVPTSFDRPGDPKSKDATVLIEVKEPFAEPRIHKIFPGSIESLEHYRLEVTHGVHNHWVNRFGEEWNYTYHERLRAYDSGDGKRIDQLENMIKIIEEKAKKGEDITNRRFQVVTWVPSVDPFIKDPPCLQRLHFRIAPDGNGSYKLNLNTDWRSRDGYKAWFMNVYAMTELQRLVADELSERGRISIGVGRYSDKSDSLHIYGKDFHGNGGFEGFLERAKREPIEKLAYETDSIKEIQVEARHLLAAQLDWEKRTGDKGKTDPDMDNVAKENYPYPKEWDK